LHPLGFVVASPQGDRSVGYPIGTELVPSWFSGRFLKRFAYSASELYSGLRAQLLGYTTVFGLNLLGL